MNSTYWSWLFHFTHITTLSQSLHPFLDLLTSTLYIVLHYYSINTEHNWTYKLQWLQFSGTWTNLSNVLNCTHTSHLRFGVLFFFNRVFLLKQFSPKWNSAETTVSSSLMCNVDFLIVLTEDNTFYLDMKLPRFTSLVNLGDKRENTDVFVLLSPTLTAHLILTLCLILTFPWDESRKKSW